MPFRNVVALQNYTNAILLEILNPTAALVTDCRADVGMLSTYGSVEQPTGPPAGWTHKAWAADKYWYLPFIFKPNTNAVIRSKLGTLVCDASNYSIDRVFIASCGSIPKFYSNTSSFPYRDPSSTTVRTIDLRSILPNIIIQPWSPSLTGIYLNVETDLSAQAASIRTWAQTAGNVFLNHALYSVLGYTYFSVSVGAGVPFTHLLTANYTKPFLSGDQVSTAVSMGTEWYRAGSPASGWTPTDLMKFTVGATDYIHAYYARYGTAGGILEIKHYLTTNAPCIIPEAWVPVYIAQVPLYLGGYLADAYVEET